MPHFKRVCINCNYHFRMTAEKRIETLFEKDKFKEINPDIILMVETYGSGPFIANL